MEFDFSPSIPMPAVAIDTVVCDVQLKDGSRHWIRTLVRENMKIYEFWRRISTAMDPPLSKSSIESIVAHYRSGEKINLPLRGITGPGNYLMFPKLCDYELENVSFIRIVFRPL